MKAERKTEMKAIVIYHSKTGFTKRYAQWIAQELNAEWKELSAAKKMDLSGYDAIIFGSWSLAGTIAKGKWFKKKQPEWHGKKLAVYCVGATPPDAPELEAFYERNRQGLETVGLYYLPGGLHYDSMPTGYRLLMQMLVKSLKAKKNRTPDDDKTAQMLSTSFDISDKKYIAPLVAYIRQQENG